MEIYRPTEMHECRCCFNNNAYCITNEETAYFTYLCESCFDKLKELEKPNKKIKKWIYVYVFEDEVNGAKTFGTTGPHFASLDEAQTNYGDCYKILFKIPESEIEGEVK